MTDKTEFDLLVFIGRFQPFHLEHKRVIDIALQKSKHVLILVGSAGSPRTSRNPFTYQERKNMIRGSYHLDQYGIDGGSYDHNIDKRLIVEPLYDKTYNDAAWINQVQNIVKETTLNIINNDGFRLHGTNDANVGLIGMMKDHTSYYLKKFPQYGSVNVDVHNVMHATSIRENFLLDISQKHEIYDNEVTPHVAKFLFDDFKQSESYQILQDEVKFVIDYKKQWEVAPYPVKHITVDSVIEQSGHILLVKRRSAPGKGLWALPGGHLEKDETLIDGVLRELREETKIKIPDPVLRGSIASTHVFDDPYRSNIGRVITYAAHIKLNDDTKLPRIKGSDDAEKAVWLPIGELSEDKMFDDHFHIINYFLGLS